MSSADAEKAMINLWDQHLGAEFGAKDAEAAVALMTDNVHVNMVALMNGAVGLAAVREYYAKHFVTQIPPDMEITPVSRTIGENRIVDENVARFTHSVQMDWLLPGLAATGKRVEVAFVSVAQFAANGKIEYEHIYWDQASVLVQLGLIDRSLPVRGAEAAAQVVKPTQPMNELIRRGRKP